MLLYKNKKNNPTLLIKYFKIEIIFIGDFMHSAITFGLVNIPIVMKPVIQNNDTQFNQLHEKCKQRISYIKYCKHCKVEVKEKNIIKGYEYQKDNYVFFDKDELSALKPTQTKEIEIVAFVPLKEIDPTYFEKSYILEPPNKSKAYNLFVEALKQSKLVAIAKTVITSKFYYCILRFLNQKIIMTTLYFEEEVNISESKNNAKVNSKELELALKIIDGLKTTFEPEKYKDEYQNNIKKAIENKLKGNKIKVPKNKSKKQITNLMEALEKSLKK